MRLEQLSELIAVNSSGDPWFDPDILFPNPKDLLDILPGLLEVEENASNYSFVKLAHFSIKEYLISERIKGQKFWLPEIQSHELIAATCLAFILHFYDRDQLFKGFNPFHGTASSNYYLTCYACENWTKHAVYADSHQGILKDLGLELFRRSGLRRSWFYYFRHHYGNPLVPGLEWKSEDIPPLFIAASVGVLGIVKVLLDSGHDVNECCAHGTALETAAAQGQNAVLRLLLENGADPNLVDRDHHPPLQAAAGFGALESLKALIDSGAKLDDERGSFGSPLIACASRGSHWPVLRELAGGSVEELVDFLLAKGVNVYISNKIYGNALQAACANGANIALIEKLVSRGIEIDARGGEYGTALQAACASGGNYQVIRFLLSQADPCIEVKESKYGTALMAKCAGLHDDDDVVQLLLDHGAKKTFRSDKYGSTLHAACSRGHIKTVRVLLSNRDPQESTAADHNLDVNEMTAPHGTPLHAACHGYLNQSRAKTVEFLIAEGADVNIRRDRPPYTALEILLKYIWRDGSGIVLAMLYNRSVVETGLSNEDAITLKRVKKIMGISPDEEIVGGKCISGDIF